MPTRVADVYRIIDKIAPFSTKLPFDNVGILVGDSFAVVNKIGVCLDITDEVVTQAADEGCDLLLAHHPVIFEKLSSVTADLIPHKLIKNGITAICAHTNLDAARGGVNDRLASALSLENVEKLPDENYPDFPECARMGVTEISDPDRFARHIKNRLEAVDVRFRAGGKPVKNVCVYCGAGSHFMLQAKAHGADTFVTAEVKHHEWLQAARLDMTVIDAGHFATENVVVRPIALLLRDKLDCEVRIVAQQAPYRAVSADF